MKLFISLLLLNLISCQKIPQNNRPNIILIMTDDQAKEWMLDELDKAVEYKEYDLMADPNQKMKKWKDWRV